MQILAPSKQNISSGGFNKMPSFSENPVWTLDLNPLIVHRAFSTYPKHNKGLWALWGMIIEWYGKSCRRPPYDNPNCTETSKDIIKKGKCSLDDMRKTGHTNWKWGESPFKVYWNFEGEMVEIRQWSRGLEFFIQGTLAIQMLQRAKLFGHFVLLTPLQASLMLCIPQGKSQQRYCTMFFLVRNSISIFSNNNPVADNSSTNFSTTHMSPPHGV